jgi:hypothetical protein
LRRTRADFRLRVFWRVLWLLAHTFAHTFAYMLQGTVTTRIHVAMLHTRCALYCYSRSLLSLSLSLSLSLHFFTLYRPLAVRPCTCGLGALHFIHCRCASDIEHVGPVGRSYHRESNTCVHSSQPCRSGPTGTPPAV